MEFVELKTESDLLASYPVITDFCPELSGERYLDSIQQMIESGYRIFALKVGEKIVSVGIVTIQIDLLNGRYLWISELVTSLSERSKGYGKWIMQHLRAFAEEQGCKKVILYSGLSRHQAHHFWEKHMGFERRGILFKLEM